jgi:glutamyl-tRNA synthetase
LAEVPGVIDFVFLADPLVDEQAWEKTMSAPGATEVLHETIEAYRELPDWNAAALKETLESVGDKHGLKKGKAQAPIRVAVTGRSIGPPLFEPLEVLGREEVLRRLNKAASA